MNPSKKAALGVIHRLPASASMRREFTGSYYLLRQKTPHRGRSLDIKAMSHHPAFRQGFDDGWLVIATDTQIVHTKIERERFPLEILV